MFLGGTYQSGAKHITEDLGFGTLRGVVMHFRVSQRRWQHRV
jgi:hypothetical protein